MKNHQLKELPVQSKPPAKTPKQQTKVDTSNPKPTEVGGPSGPEPTRFGDWEQAGRCTDF